MDGLLFGGYTELEWDSYSRDKNDNSTFIFSFNTNKKYTKRNNKYSIGCYNQRGLNLVGALKQAFAIII